ncbi:MAG: 1-(5-phosphoribosyl)-5-[(5-phosphoribosylamino)methylideneamino]imidazole-4-carboxamide isomerase [Flavobacteriaceae bacterium]|nr:1-(5-phosphoribosyl)-5-[(5-phosphoribosylamino)methylideneamino]imidazole-4-carboxamide isomerase [Flavobacteriaceae bacterium]|tara:strand:+ start:14205 stop:14933 length:729 start_codon:yes stop_codon:yes gene_type:complete
MTIIPAMDIIKGKCVRLTQGDYNQKTEYNADPLDMAKRFEDAGLTHLHLVDLEGAKAKHIVNYKVLETLASKTSLKIDFGGGVKTDAAINIAFESGAAQITAGSVAARNPEQVARWVASYGAERIIIGADVKNKMIAVSGWKETTSLAVIPFIESYIPLKLHRVICTDVAKDGMLRGPSVDLYKELLEAIPTLQLVASGGISSLKDLGILEQIGCDAAIIGKAIYEGRLSLSELEKWNANAH